MHQLHLQQKRNLAFVFLPRKIQGPRYWQALLQRPPLPRLLLVDAGRKHWQLQVLCIPPHALRDTQQATATVCA